MKLAPIAALGIFVLAGCPGDDSTNPDTLWLAPDMAETHVKLVGQEPHPF